MDGGMPNTSIEIAKRPISELEAEITQLAGHINAASYRWLTLIAEFDKRNGWVDWGAQSCAHWLNWVRSDTFSRTLNVSSNRANDSTWMYGWAAFQDDYLVHRWDWPRVAHSLAKLPKIAASMATGALSYSKVRAMTRVATEAIEDTLLMIALNGSAHHVEKVVRSYRDALEATELSRDQKQQANRSVTYHWDSDGSLILHARLPAEVGALVVKALDIGMEELSTNVSAETV